MSVVCVCCQTMTETVKVAEEVALAGDLQEVCTYMVMSIWYCMWLYGYICIIYVDVG